ncbi:MAG: hypothetical protein ACOYJD_01305 [Christensenellales bacterium]|jgi:niacin transporter
MKKNNALRNMIIAGLLCAIGILIPRISPIRIVLEPASFTLASHVAIFIAMFISPGVAGAVAVGTTLGFLFGGFPIVIVARAASQVVFAVAGAFFYKKHPHVMDSLWKSQLFSFCIALVHGAMEVIAVLPFYFTNTLASGFYEKGFMFAVILMVGVGTVVHSMVDFGIAQLIWRPLKKALRSSQ